MTETTDIEKACVSVATAMARLIATIRYPSTKEVANQTCDAPATGSDTEIEHVRFRGSTDRRLFVYCAGCQGLAQLAQQHGPKIMSKLGLESSYITKCGTTRLDLPTRLGQIGQDQYGAAVRTKNGIEVQAGFKGWVAHAITTSRPSRDPAVTVMTRAIAVDRLPGMSSRTFDIELHKALKGRALDALPAAVWPRRFCAYDLVELRHSAARELYALCPYAADDGDLLLTAIEGVLERFRERRGKKT